MPCGLVRAANLTGDVVEELASVVIPTHNRSHLLTRAVESVLRQTWRNLEVIVVDDASTDDTPELLARLAATDARVKTARFPASQGGAAARNEGLRVSTGMWAAFLDDDDSWEPEKLARQIALLRQTPDAAAVTCSFTVNTPGGGRRRVDMPDDLSLDDLLEENYLGGASVCLARREMLREVGGFDARLSSGQDWDLWVKLRLRGRIVNCRHPLVNYYEHPGERITTRMDRKYAARRRFYMLHRKRMGRRLRQYHLAWAMYYRSWRPDRALGERRKSLCRSFGLALRLGRIRLALSFIKNGLLPLFRK